MFCFPVGGLLDELALHAPAILDAVKTALAAARRAQLDDGGSLCELPAAQFAAVPDNSIDYALMEKTRKAAVVCCDLGWDDIGSWAALAEQYPADEQGNVTEGEVFLHGVSNTYVRAEGRVAGVVGVDNLIVVDTPDALLVAHRDRVQEVKHIVSQLKQAGHDAHRLHRTVHRPWGSYTVLEEGPRFKIKRIVVKPGASLSLQMHHHRSEHWVIVSGMARVTNGDRELFVSSNESTYIPAGHRHRLENPGKLDLVMIEVQCGDYVGEDDIVRFSDHYGRSDGSPA
jgi:mannose-1-phosphate guanylyltransferase